MDFINEYFKQSVYNGARISVYNITTNELIYSLGEPIKLNKTEADKRPNFFYSEQLCKNGEVIVYTAMPYTMSLTEALAPDSTMWVTIILLSLFVTIIAFISTFYIG